MRRLEHILIGYILLLATIGCGAGSGPTVVTPQALNLAGKWEFANGMNLNIAQSGSGLSGTSVEQSVASTPPNTNTLQVQPCTSGAVTGTVSASSVSLQSDGCGATTATADATGTVLSGGTWGNAFKVASVTGQYSGALAFYDASGNAMGTSNATLTLSEDQNHNVTGTLNVEAGNPVQLSGQAVGGVIDLNNGALVGRIQNGGGIQITESAYFMCLAFGGCSAVGNGVLK